MCVLPLGVHGCGAICFYGVCGGHAIGNVCVCVCVLVWVFGVLFVCVLAEFLLGLLTNFQATGFS